MKTASAKAARSKVREIEPFDKRRIVPTNFKPDLSGNDLRKLLEPIGDLKVFPFLAIETLSVTKTIGRGRTNLTLAAPTVVQTDAAMPRAFFNKQAQSRNPATQMHFEPSAYGITSVGDYIMEFAIEVFGQSTFVLAGFAGVGGTVLNGGTKVLNGRTRVSLIFRNVSASAQTFGFLEQTAGGRWDWFSTQVRFPDLVITQ